MVLFVHMDQSLAIVADGTKTISFQAKKKKFFLFFFCSGFSYLVFQMKRKKLRCNIQDNFYHHKFIFVQSNKRYTTTNDWLMISFYSSPYFYRLGSAFLFPFDVLHKNIHTHFSIYFFLHWTNWFLCIFLLVA